MKHFTTAIALLLGVQMPTLFAQSACNSDGTAAPQALFERFISADCADCWADAQTPAPGSSAAVLDWIVPSAAGEDAALAAAARRDALERLNTLKRALPQPSDVHVSTRADSLPGRFRVALGPAVNDYVSALVSYAGPVPALAQQEKQGLAVWLALVEQIPAGVESSAVPRNLVRGVFRTQWQQRNQLKKGERINLPRDMQWIDRVSMQLPAGTSAERLSVIAWAQTADGTTLGIVQAACAAR